MKKRCKDCLEFNSCCDGDCLKNNEKLDVGGKHSNLCVSDLQIGEVGDIWGYSEDINEKFKRRLLELGFVVGEKVKIENTSIMKDVFLVAVRGCLMSVRREILNFVYVVKNK